MIPKIPWVRPGDDLVASFLNRLAEGAYAPNNPTPVPPLGLAQLPTGHHVWVDLSTLIAPTILSPTLQGTTLQQGGSQTVPLPPPAQPSATNTGPGGHTLYAWAITAVAANGGETTLSLPVLVGTGPATLTAADGVTLFWPPQLGAVSYNVYRIEAGGSPSTLGLIGNTPGTSFTDTGLPATAPPPATNSTCLAAGNAFMASGGATFLLLPAPGAPTVTPLVTGSTGYTYAVSLVTPTGATQLGSAGSTSTGSAVLTTATANGLTWPVPAGVPAALVPTLTYMIERTASSGTPSTTGVIGFAGPFPLGTTPSFTDTGLPVIQGVPAAPSSNLSNVVSVATLSGFSTVQLPTPAAPSVVPQGATGSTPYTYVWTANDPTGSTPASASGSTAIGPASLSAANPNLVTGPAVPGNPVSYTVWRIAGGGSTGRIGTVTASPGAPLSFLDTGLPGDSATPPVTNTTGQILQAGGPPPITISSTPLSGGTQGCVLFQWAGAVDEFSGGGVAPGFAFDLDGSLGPLATAQTLYVPTSLALYDSVATAWAALTVSGGLLLLGSSTVCLNTIDNAFTVAQSINATGASGSTANLALTLNMGFSTGASAGFGSKVVWEGKSSTTGNRNMAEVDVTWATATDASRKAQMTLVVYDTSARTFLTAQADGNNAITAIGAAAPVSNRTLTVTAPAASYIALSVASAASPSKSVCVINVPSGTPTAKILTLQLAGADQAYFDSTYRLVLVAATTSGASLNVPSGTAPTSPAAGDLWYDGTHLYFRSGGGNHDLLAGAVTNTNNSAALGASYSLTSSFANVGVNVTLPNIGTYLLTCTVYCELSNSGSDFVEALLFDTTASAAVSGSKVSLCGTSDVDTACRQSATITVLYTTLAVNHQIDLQATTSLGSTGQIIATNTVLSYVQVA